MHRGVRGRSGSLSFARFLNLNSFQHCNKPFNLWSFSLLTKVKLWLRLSLWPETWTGFTAATTAIMQSPFSIRFSTQLLFSANGNYVSARKCRWWLSQSLAAFLLFRAHAYITSAQKQEGGRVVENWSKFADKEYFFVERRKGETNPRNMWTSYMEDPHI